MSPEKLGLLILVVFCITSLVQFIYYYFIYIRFLLVKDDSKTTARVPVSIVICARNEAENLEKFLPLVCEQQYPDFEVVVVNDCSDDDTEDVLKRLMVKYSNLRTTFIKEDEKFAHGKKLALTVGIKSARNEWMLLTDADCYPESNHWLARMAAHFTEDKSIVLAYGGYVTGKGFLNKLIRFDTAIIALNYISFALIGKPYMGVGRNLAYRRSLFFANKGFASHARLDSGDDDLFINEVAKNNNVDVEISKESHTRSEPETTFDYWVEQKSRHFTTFSKYKKGNKYLLGAEILSRILFYILFIWLLLYKEYYIVALSIFFVRMVTQLVIWKKTFARLNEKNLLLISPMMDLVLPFIHLGIYLSNAIRPRRQWR